MSTLFLKMKKSTFPGSNISTLGEKTIIPKSVLKKEIQKTSGGLNNLHANDYS